MRLTYTFALLVTGVATLASAGVAAAQAVPHFTAPHTYVSNTVVDGPSMFWSAAGDFNGDGLIDLAAPDVRGLNNLLGFSVAFGLPDGSFDTPVTRSVGTFVRTLRAADLNHDGRADLVIVTLAGAAVVQGNSDGTFSAPVGISLPLVPNDATLADFNGDGNVDIVFPGDLGYAVALGSGAGTFTRGRLMAETAPTFWATAGDFNNDGVMDFTGAGGIFGHTYFGNADGSFQPPIDAFVAAPSGSISGDFNGDGNIDIAMLRATPRQDGSNYGISVAIGAGDGTFFNGAIGIVFGQLPISNLVAGDFNADGLSDVAAYNTNTGTIQVIAGDRQFFGRAIASLPVASSGVMFAGDVDGNGSPDLVLSNSLNFTVFRNTHGNPPLVAQVTLTPAAVIGGAATSGVVQLGGAAPPEGALVSLTASDPAVASFPSGVTVAIPGGASSAAFPIATSAVDTASTVTVTAEWNGVAASVPLSVVPAYTLSAFVINPGSQYGIFSAVGTLTLSAPADAAATVQLTSANPSLASVPASVRVPAGATSVDFPIVLSPVATDTPVTITASRSGVSLTSSITVLKATDTVSISRALLTQKTSDLKIEAASTSAAATLTVYNAATGAFLGTLDNAGGGKYKGSVVLFVPANAPAPTITVKSTLGGSRSIVVQLK
jgi:hypothetical protein